MKFGPHRKLINIEKEVDAAIMRLAEPHESRNSVIRRLLNMPPTKQKQGVRKRKQEKVPA